VVRVKAVVGVRAAPHRVVDEDGTARPYRWHLGLPDRVAVEAALRSCEGVIVVGVGGDRAREAVRSALAMGADRGVHVEYDPIDEAIGEKYATVLARAAARERPDALFVAEDAPRWGSEVATLAGETLDWAVVSRVTALGVDDVDASPTLGDDETAVQRKVETGRQEVLAVTFPAVVGVATEFANPRRADFATAVAGRRAEVETVALEDVAPGETRFSMSVGRANAEAVVPNARWGRGDPPRTGSVEERIARMLGRGEAGEETGGDVIEVPPDAAAERVVEYLRANDLL